MLDLTLLDQWRDRSPEAKSFFDGNAGGAKWGRFFVKPAFGNRMLVVLATSSDGWDHVSVSTHDRCPTWEEMEFVKRLCFAPDETAMQLHVPPADHINCHPYCLHIWRPLDAPIPRPPALMVGINARESLT